jgi:alkylation response protein AidB-like acyl-CoA dehydrogenase
MNPTALTDEQQMIKETARRFAETELAPIAIKMDETSEFQVGDVRQDGRAGLHGTHRSRRVRRTGTDTCRTPS